jgi:hypothetical protein
MAVSFFTPTFLRKKKSTGITRINRIGRRD